MTKTMPRSPKCHLVLTLGLLAACGGGEPSSAEDAAPPELDTLVRSIPREPLTEADLVGFSLAEVSVELPWTTNRVSRGGGPQAARAGLQSVDVTTHEGFDRTVFRFTDTAPFPGYDIELSEVAALDCDGEELTPGLGGESALVIRLLPARARDGSEVVVPVRTEGLGMVRFQEGGLVCEDQEGLIWAASLTEGTQIRAFELRSPNRLVVDIR
jgi:hypothetical protein